VVKSRLFKKLTRKRSVYWFIIILTVFSVCFIIFVLGSATEEYYNISHNTVKTNEYKINENVTKLEFDLFIDIHAKKIMTKLAINYVFSDNVNFTPFFESQYDGGDDDTLRARRDTKLVFHCNTTNTTFWYVKVIISFNDEFDVYHEGEHLITYTGIEKIPSLSITIVLIIIILFAILRRTVISKRKQE